MLENNEQSVPVCPADQSGQAETLRPKDKKKPFDPEILRRREFRAKYCQGPVERAITFVIDQYWNTPLWNGRNADGVHQCPKGPQDASNWAWISHRPSVGAERWRIIPWGEWCAIRYQPIGWEPHWCIIGVYFTIEQAREALEAI